VFYHVKNGMNLVMVMDLIAPTYAVRRVQISLAKQHFPQFGIGFKAGHQTNKNITPKNRIPVEELYKCSYEVVARLVEQAEAQKAGILDPDEVE
jgi:hypothetical protein